MDNTFGSGRQTQPRLCYFFMPAFTFWIPSRIISLRVLSNSSQQKSKSAIVCLSALIFNCISFGFSALGLPVREDMFSPLFMCTRLLYSCVHIKSRLFYSKLSKTFCYPLASIFLWKRPVICQKFSLTLSKTFCYLSLHFFMKRTPIPASFFYEAGNNHQFLLHPSKNGNTKRAALRPLLFLVVLRYSLNFCFQHCKGILTFYAYYNTTLHGICQRFFPFVFHLVSYDFIQFHFLYFHRFLVSFFCSNSLRKSSRFSASIGGACPQISPPASRWLIITAQASSKQKAA